MKHYLLAVLDLAAIVGYAEESTTAEHQQLVKNKGEIE